MIPTASICSSSTKRRRPSSTRAIFVSVLSVLQAQSLHSFSICPSNYLSSNRPSLSSILPLRRHEHWSRLHDAAAAPPLETATVQEDPEFDRLSRTHTVVEKLKVQIPTLLSTPLTEASAKAVYDDDLKLVVDDDIELASSRTELESLSTTLVLAVLATNQANSFFANALAGTANNSTTVSALESSMAMDPTSTAIRVDWKVTLPGQQQQQNSLRGVSELELDPIAGKVTTLRLLKVQFNQERLNARAIAESLSSLRQLVSAFQNPPFLPKSGLPSLSTLLGSDFVQQVSRQGESDTKPTEPPPLFITESLQTAFMGYNLTSNKNATTNDTTTALLIPIDDYFKSDNNNTTPLPLPGSQIWNQYVAARRVSTAFRQNTLRILSGNLSVASSEMLELFSPQAVLKAADGSDLLRGRDAVGNFFLTLASFRKRSSGTWELANATLLSNNNDKDNDRQVTIAVDYRATSSVPGASSPVVIEGTDYFTLESPILTTNSDPEEEGQEDDDEDVEILIKQIEQRRVNIIGGGGGNRSPDGLWFMKSLVALEDAGRLGSGVGADSVVMDLLQRVLAGENGRSGERTTKRKRKRTRPPKLPEPVAARVYAIMSSLHEDVPTLFEKEMLRTYQLPPLHEYMTKDVELRGYLGETLARGLPSYNTALGTTFSSLKGALATGGAKLDPPEPTVVVELTAEGNVRLSLTVNLKVLPLPSGAGNLINSMSGSAISLPSGGFNLKFAIVSDYVFDKETGEIYQHRVVETRINDQLTPGDVISRWIQKQVALTNPKDGANSDGAVAGMRGLVDAISWVRTVSGRG